MANRQRFNPDALTCATWHYPLGSVLRVSTVVGADCSVVVVVTDRGPHPRLVRRDNRRLDLSLAAFRELAGDELGLVQVNITRLR